MGYGTKAEATVAAKRLQKRMCGKGWKYRVWENLGWHYSVHNGGMTVHPSCVKGEFFTLLSSGGDLGSGECYWTPSGTRFKDPNAAVRFQILKARKFVGRVQEAVESVAVAIGMKRRPLK